jgi:phosphatidylserine decarboxylase
VDIIGVPFYALVIDLLNTDYGRTFFALTEVNCFLKPIYDKYGAMLDTPYSLKHMNAEADGWLSEAALKRIKYEDFICNPKAPYYGFNSWHAWFTREIREEARPFNKTAENEILNNSEYYPNFGMPYIKALWHDKFWLKDQRYSLAEVFGADSLPLAEQQYFKDHFEGGTVFQGFLDPWCYHHWRSPVSGLVEKSYKIGNSYYAGNPSLSSHLAESYIASLPLLTMTSVRQIYVIKADNPKIGRVCVIEIGMAEVSGIDQCIKEGQRIEKGARLGNFRFGGSSHAFVFDNKAQNLTFHGIYERDSKGQPVKQLVRSVLATVE